MPLLKRTIPVILLFFFCAELLQAQSESLVDYQPGDLLFVSLRCGPLCDAIETVTVGYNNHKFSHVGMLVAQNGELRVLEAIGSVVTTTKLDSFMLRGKNKALHARLLPKYQPYVSSAISYAITQLGMPYDDEFLPDNGKWYCSELIFEAFKQAKTPTLLFNVEPMNFKDPIRKEFFPAWVTYYQKLNKAIPQDVPGCNPGGLSRSPYLQVLGWKTFN